jgi:hypothetical protein
VRLRGTVVAVLALAGCGGDAPLRPALHHVRPGSCPVTAPLGRARAPRGLATLAGPSDADDSFGRGGLWVLLPSATANAVPVHAGYSVKVGWYLDGDGDLRLGGERLDGAGSVDYDTYQVPGPGPRMQASSLTLSALGCYAIEGEHHGEAITWVFRAAVSPRPPGNDPPAGPGR